MPKSENNFLLTRVSSQATTVASRKISTARDEMSCKLPMGVEMMYKPFLNIFLNFDFTKDYFEYKYSIIFEYFGENCKC